MDAVIGNKPSELKVITDKEIHHLLEPGELGAILELIVTDKDGKVTEHRVMKSKSFVKQFLQLLMTNMLCSGSAYFPSPVAVNTVGAQRDLVSLVMQFNCNAAVNIATYGIHVGTGPTAPTIDDYKLETLIAHGVGAGQLSYGAVTFGAASSDATTAQFTITRNFANSSGGPITVNEIGLVVLFGAVYSSTDYFLTIRDVIAGGIAVPNGQTLTVNYRPQTVI